MSIYATLWKLKFPQHGDDYPGCEWITVTAQGVPAHIGARGDDPFADFLPPPVRAGKDGEPEYLRAVVFVTEQTPKGTPRSGQEYVSPLLVLSGEAYARVSFEALHARLCDALRGDRPRVAATVHAPDGRTRIVFEDGTAGDARSASARFGQWAPEAASIRLLDVVALTEDVAVMRLRRGQVGTVVEILAPEVHEIEFCDDEGRTCASTALSASRLLVLRYRPQVTA